MKLKKGSLNSKMVGRMGGQIQARLRKVPVLRLDQVGRFLNESGWVPPGSGESVCKGPREEPGRCERSRLKKKFIRQKGAKVSCGRFGRG